MSILRTSLLALALAPTTLLAAAPVQPAPPAFDSSIISGLGARNIGSAAMSGRISSLDATTLADGKLYASKNPQDNERALALTARSAQIDDELLAAMERWEQLSATV